MTSQNVSVPRNNYDIIIKFLTRMFAHKTLDFYGINTAPVVRAEPTDLPQVKVEERRMDFVFYLADDSYLHLEFQTTASVADLERFKVYDVALYEQKKKTIHTVVIYGAGIGKAPETLDHGSVKYITQAVYRDRYDGDKIYRELVDKVNRGAALSDIDRLNLIFLPLMKSATGKSQRAIEAVELAGKIPDEQQQMLLIGCLVGISDKFIDKEYVRKMMEVLRMTRVFQEIYAEGRAEGRVEGKQEVVRDYLDMKFGFDSLELQEKIKKLDSSEILDGVLKRLFNSDSLEKARAIIEEALRAQAKLKHLQ